MSTENELATNVAGTDTAAPDTSSGMAETGQPSAQPSLDDSLRAAFKNLRQDDGQEAGGETQNEGRVRGPDGKFLPKVEGQATETDPAQAAPANEQPQAATPKPHDVVPNTWKKELGAEFVKLPESVRQEIHKREQDFHRGIGQYKEAAGFGQQLAQEMLPYQQDMQQNNIHPRDVVKTLLPAWKTLATGSAQDKANLVLQLVKDYGIDFTSLGTDPQQGTAQKTQDDPRLATALQRLEKLEGTLTAQERQRAEAEYNANLEAVNKFGSDPKHEHYNAVREEMAALLNSGQANDLQDAYDKAIWIKPEVRASLLAKQEQERANKLAADAANARKAAGANVTRRGTPPVKPNAGSMEESLRRRYRELNGA